MRTSLCWGSFALLHFRDGFWRLMLWFWNYSFTKKLIRWKMKSRNLLCRLWIKHFYSKIIFWFEIRIALVGNTTLFILHLFQERFFSIYLVIFPIFVRIPIFLVARTTSQHLDLFWLKNSFITCPLSPLKCACQWKRWNFELHWSILL